MSYYEEGGKLVEEIVQPTVKKVYNRTEIEEAFEKAKANFQQKQLEAAGAEQEVARLNEMLDCCDDLNIKSNDEYDGTEESVG